MSSGPGTGRQGTHASSRATLGPAAWVIHLALLLVTAVTLWRVHDMLGSRGGRAVGDGRDPATYGFDLSGFSGNRALLVAGGVPRDGIPVLDLPPSWPVARVDSLAHTGRNKYLVNNDRVIGVTMGGRARAYPLMILNWHEVVNDTLGGVPIAVTYSPLCDAAVVYLREAPILLGHSGLLYNSDALLYDRRPDHQGESLFNQITGRAEAGPARVRAESLRVASSSLLRWSDWKARFPETTILWRDPARLEMYRRDPYSSYFGNDLLRFPAAPLPADGRWPRKTPCLVLSTGPERAVLPLPLLASRVDRTGSWQTAWHGIPLTFHWSEPPSTAWVEASGNGTGPTVRQVCWFAWYAMEDGRLEIIR